MMLLVFFRTRYLKFLTFWSSMEYDDHMFSYLASTNE